MNLVRNLLIRKLTKRMQNCSRSSREIRANHIKQTACKWNCRWIKSICWLIHQTAPNHDGSRIRKTRKVNWYLQRRSLSKEAATVGIFIWIFKNPCDTYFEEHLRKAVSEKQKREHELCIAKILSRSQQQPQTQ